MVGPASRIPVGEKSSFTIGVTFIAVISFIILGFDVVSTLSVASIVTVALVASELGFVVKDSALGVGKAVR